MIQKWYVKDSDPLCTNVLLKMLETNDSTEIIANIY